MQQIDFYEPIGTYGAFSNFFLSPTIIDGMTYPTIEHYFQAQKFLGPTATSRSREYAQLIAAQSTPNKAKILANQQIKGGYKWVQDLNAIIRQYPDVQLRADWDQVRDNIMRRGVYQKFKQNPGLTNLLLSTGQALLVEHTNRDAYWGDGGDGRGRNQLGRTLMEVRSLLRGESFLDDPMTWLVRGVVLTGPVDRTALNRIGANFLIDLTPDHQITRNLLGDEVREPVTVFPGPYIFANGPQVALTVEAIGKKYIVFIAGLDKKFLQDLLQALYGPL